jgi:Uma2 family endonuclease
MAMNSLDDIKAAIQRLAAQERRALHSWLVGSFPYDTDVLGDHVAEPAAANFKLRLQVDQRDLFYYPNIMVACGREGVASHYLHYPKLIVEVLSPSTQSIDRREKFLSCTQIATVEEYALASQDTAQIAIHRRAEKWAPRMHTGPDSLATFQSIGLTLSLRQIYEGVLYDCP